MKTIRSAAVSAGALLFAVLGAQALSGCIMPTVVGDAGDDEAEVQDGDTTGAGDDAASSPSGAGAAGSNDGSDDVKPGKPVLIFDADGTGLNPWGIAVDAGNVYFTDAQGPTGKVVRVPLQKGGSPVTLADGQYLPSAIAVDGPNVYFTTSYNLKKVPVAGGPVVDLAPSEDAGYAQIAIDATHVYWTNYTWEGSTMRIPKAGGMPETLDSGDQWPSGIVVHNGQVYWSALSDNVIKQAPVAGGPATVFASDQPAVRMALAADSTYLYWYTEGEWPNSLYKAPLAGGPPVLVTASPEPNSSLPTTLLIDASYAYFALPSCGIAKVPLAGGATQKISLDEKTVGCPHRIAADAANIYYTSLRGITKLPK